jgi:glutaconate CoA-transferase subunit B
VVITDLGVLRPDPKSNELKLVATHPGVSVEDGRAATGWELQIAADLTVTEPPTDEELAILRDLKARTMAAHAT